MQRAGRSETISFKRPPTFSNEHCGQSLRFTVWQLSRNPQESFLSPDQTVLLVPMHYSNGMNVSKTSLRRVIDGADHECSDF